MVCLQTELFLNSDKSEPARRFAEWMIYPQVREEPIVDRNTFTNYPRTGQICSSFQLLSAPPIKQNDVDFRWEFHAPGSGFLPKLRFFRKSDTRAKGLYGQGKLRFL